ncbi:hypothetical protein BJV82DRAFT_175248 [Fennellomyces sp. T-0311]|nr:hypothetical protein BJV82DRAFT_175248 [Fennellomyces sp. T-0311]
MRSLEKKTPPLKNRHSSFFKLLLQLLSQMSEHDSKSEEERIQAMLQQSSDQWDEQQDQLPSNSNASPKQHMRSPQPFPNPMMNAPPGFNPMMNFAMLNPQLQFQQMMMQQQMQQMHQPRQAMGQSNIPPETQKPPVGYVCFKCRQPGHWIYYCPNVPKGQFVPRPDMNGSQQAQQHDASSAKQKPSELTCRICGKLMKDAVLVPCCGKSFCKECITTKLDETSKCPVCNKEDVRSSQVIPNRSLRNTIQAYQEQSDKEAEAAAAEAANVQPAEEPAEDRQQQQQQQQQPIKDEPMVTDNDVCLQVAMRLQILTNSCSLDPWSMATIKADCLSKYLSPKNAHLVSRNTKEECRRLWEVHSLVATV